MQQLWDDHRIEVIIGVLLRVGVLIAAAVVLTGAGIYLARHGSEPVDFRTFRGATPQLRTISGIVSGSIQESGKSIIQLGLLLLIATPVARVAFSAIAFWLERDYLYVGITLAVLAVLAYSLIGSAIR
jgi:uncharacterized membrane protein